MGAHRQHTKAAVRPMYVNLDTALRMIRARALDPPEKYDFRQDVLALVDALDAVLAVHAPTKLMWSDGYVCQVDYDKPWPCATRVMADDAISRLFRGAGK